MDIRGKKILVLGLGVSGEAAAELLLKQGAKVVVLDDKVSPELKRRARDLQRKGAVVRLGQGKEGRLGECDLVVLSPGIPSSHLTVKMAEKKGIPVIGEIELAYRFLSETTIAVTGTNGKSTTVALIAEMLNRQGVRCALGGNIGLPLSQVALGRAVHSLLVAEVSSFQLEHIGKFRPSTGVFLNFSPDHLDRYPDLRAYREAKLQLFRNQDRGDRAVLPSDSPGWLRKAIPSPVKKVYWGGARGMVFREGRWLRAKVSGRVSTICRVKEVTLLGSHNLSNVMAASTVALLQGVDPKAIRETLVNFRGLPHRLEYLLSRNDIRFYNDSKATNPGAVKMALQSFTRPVIWIAGGSDKGFDFKVLKSLVRRKVKLALFLGETKRKLKRDLGGGVTSQLVGSLKEAVSLAFKKAEPHDVVLLSPGCASFDMFKNYEERGNVFKALIKDLANKS